MKMKRFTLFALFLAGMVSFVACEKDDTKDLNKDEAQQQITNAEQELLTKSGEIVATDGYKVQEYFATQLPSPFYLKSNVSKSFVPSRFQKAYELTRQNLLLEDPEIEFHTDYFIIEFFNDVKGTWTWTPDGWTHESTPTDKVIVKFPYPANNATNNVTITYYDFTTTLVYGETVPTGIKVKIEKDGNQVFSLSYSATITNLLKHSTKVEIAFGAFTLTAQESLDLSINNKFYYGKDFEFKKSGKLFYGEIADLTSTFTTDSTANVSITAKQIIGNLEFRLKIEANTSELETGNPNDLASLSLYTTSGDKVGDFVWVLEGEDWVLYFKFNNGEQVKAETLMPLVAERFYSFIDDLFSNLDGK